MRHFIIPLLLTLFLSWPRAAHAAGADTFDDALSVLNLALELDDIDALESLINPDLGLDVAGQVLDVAEFQTDIHNRSERLFDIFSDGEYISTKSSFEEFLWCEDGALTIINETTLTHYEIIDREELDGVALIERWEHGELEAAVVADEPHLYNVYILPDLKWRITFTKIDDTWFLSGIAARE